jgi:hypothetical protein
MTDCTQGNVIGITLYHHSCDGKFRGHGHTNTTITITAADPHISGSADILMVELLILFLLLLLHIFHNFCVHNLAAE